MWVRLLRGFWDAEAGKSRAPGEKVNIRKDLAESMIAGGLAIPCRKRKEPAENKAKVPSENKGAGE